MKHLICLIIYIYALPVFSSPICCMDQNRHAIVDTDANLEDLIAVLCLLKSPNTSIKGIFIVGCGACSLSKGGGNLLDTQLLSGKYDVPVYLGAQNSLSEVGAISPQKRREVDVVAGIKMPRNQTQTLEANGVENMVRILMECEKKMTVFCMGPLTNIANALKSKPEIKNKIERIFISAGTLLNRGNMDTKVAGYKNHVAEFNIAMDARSASDVFESGLPITLIPTDVFDHTHIGDKMVQNIKEKKDTAAANFLYELVSPCKDNYTKLVKNFFATASVIIANSPEIATYRNLRLGINLKKGPEYGKVMINKHGNSINVVTSINKDDMFEKIFNLLNKKIDIKAAN